MIKNIKRLFAEKDLNMQMDRRDKAFLLACRNDNKSPYREMLQLEEAILDDYNKKYLELR